MALSLGVNRPSYVTGALWRAMTSTNDPRGDFDKIAGLLWNALTKHAKKYDYDESDVQAAGVGPAYAELQALFWPTGATTEAALELKMKQLALTFYRSGERGERERRLATVTASPLAGPR